MIYLYGYLGIGAILLAGILISHQLTKSLADDLVSEVLQATDPRSNQWWWKPLNKVGVPILFAIAVTAIWPLVIYWKAKEMVDARRPTQNKEPPKEFAVTQEHLRRQWTVAEIESAETVVDPLNAAPRIPFGHLNPAWETFKPLMADGDQIWSFYAHWTTKWGHHEVRDGYVLVRGGSIGPHFLARCEYIEEEDSE